ncbi:LOW QUALITY PROTEIN: protein disulfide-isomerase-like protein of the testis [Amazona ochrocephala]
MKTHQFFLLPLFFTGFLAADSISPNETKPKKAKLLKIKKQNNVLFPKKSNFDVLKETKYLLVELYVSLSKSSQNFSEEFAEAAQQLKTAAPRIQSGETDVTYQPDLRKFNIQEFPTVKFFVAGSREDPIDCKGVRQASAFIIWVKRRTGPSTVLINSTDEAEAIINADDFTVTGFFKELHSDTVEVFFEMARDVPEMPFGTTASEDVCANGIQKNTLVVLKKGGVQKPRRQGWQDGRQNKLDLMRLIKTFILALVTEYNFETSVKTFDVPVENHILLFAPTNSEMFSAIYENYKPAAAEFTGKIMFVLVDINEPRKGEFFEYFRIREVDVPAVRILNLTSEATMPADEVTVENLKEVFQSDLNGKAKLDLSSEEIPEDWHKMPVKVLVGKNFNSIVFDKTRTVFVMFFKCYSYDCRKILPIWDEGERYESRTDIIIAKTDVTANNILSVGLARYPVFRLFPAGPDYQEVAYAGEHTLEAFSEFLEEQNKTKAEEKDPLGGIKEVSQKETVTMEKEEVQ